MVAVTSCLYVCAVVAITLAAPALASKKVNKTRQDRAQKLLDEFNRQATLAHYPSVQASWTYATNLTEYNKKMKVAENMKYDKFLTKWGVIFSKVNKEGLKPITRRELGKLSGGDSSFNDTRKEKQLSNDAEEMERIFSAAKVCMDDTQKPCKKVPLDPDLIKIFATSRDSAKLLKAWDRWHQASGPPMKKIYEEHVELSNERSRANGLPDTGYAWRSAYDSPTFEEDMEALWAQIKPLYEHLHGFVRRRLRKFYTNVTFPASGHIPAHLLGNMWAQHWDTIMDLVTPFPDKGTVDVTQEMIRQDYTVERMFHTADGFFTSLGLKKLTKPFWDKSMIRRPTDGRDVVCHPSAWDFYNAKDFRIKMCAEVNQITLNDIHHEMGHVQYYMQYSHLPHAFRRGANPAFHEAIGDTMQLSARTPKHLSAIGLLKGYTNDTESDINFLMSIALTKLAFLPFGYLVDQWRWRVFRGDTAPEEYNDHWWQLRCRHQGVSAPLPRPGDAFDPGAKYHVASGTPYIRYFLSFNMQFQFHKALCEKAGHTGPLHTCDIYKSKKAGRHLASLLRQGSSKNWPELMQEMTGTPRVDAGALIEYFKPLLEFFKKENGNDYGWDPQCPPPAPSRSCRG